MTFLKRAYQVVLPASVLLLGFLLYQEHQMRELAVTGARLDAIELHLRHVETMANALELPEVKNKAQSARAYFERALTAYREKDFRITRIHIHNTMWDLDIATTVLLVRTAPPEVPDKDGGAQTP